jgi:hypothetical protein
MLILIKGRVSQGCQIMLVPRSIENEMALGFA